MLPWYQDGLRFSCTGCGKCCTGSPGYVWVSLEEIDELARFLDLTRSEFCQNYVRKIGEKFSLVEQLPHFDCVFYKNQKCTVYEARPKQCKTFPFWPKHLADKSSWDDLKTFCEGVTDEAPLVTQEEIERCCPS